MGIVSLYLTVLVYYGYYCGISYLRCSSYYSIQVRSVISHVGAVGYAFGTYVSLNCYLT